MTYSAKVWLRNFLQRIYGKLQISLFTPRGGEGGGGVCRRYGPEY